MLTTAATVSTGSPPQVRGKLTVNVPLKPRLGITPAGAGKTYTASLKTAKRKDHPRRCGENRFAAKSNQNAPGSPPQVRGKPYPNRIPSPRIGITPAGAGKTHVPSIFREIFQDHPRRCGENVNSPVQRLFATGSPPQVRGKLQPMSV